MTTDKIKINSYRGLSLFLFTWAVIATYFSFFPFPDSNKTQEVKKTHTERGGVFLRGFLRHYYTIGLTKTGLTETDLRETDLTATGRLSDAPGIEKKLTFISSHFSPHLEKKVLSEYRHTLDYFSDNMGWQKVSIKKILRNKKTNTYIAFFYITQKLNAQNIAKPTTSYLIKLKIRLSIQKVAFKISAWDEKILKLKPSALNNKGIYTDREVTTHISIPCKITSLATIVNDNNIEMKLSSNSQGIKFHSNKPSSKIAKFKANCRSTSFFLSLTNDEYLETLYQAFDLSQGVSRAKTLSPDEKLKKDIEEQLGITVTK